jgi:hypothetical protein
VIRSASGAARPYSGADAGEVFAPRNPREPRSPATVASIFRNFAEVINRGRIRYGRLVASLVTGQAMMKRSSELRADVHGIGWTAVLWPWADRKSVQVGASARAPVFWSMEDGKLTSRRIAAACLFRSRVDRVRVAYKRTSRHALKFRRQL